MLALDPADSLDVLVSSSSVPVEPSVPPPPEPQRLCERGRCPVFLFLSRPRVFYFTLLSRAVGRPEQHPRHGVTSRPCPRPRGPHARPPTVACGLVTCPPSAGTVLPAPGLRGVCHLHAACSRVFSMRFAFLGDGCYDYPTVLKRCPSGSLRQIILISARQKRSVGSTL